MTSELLTAKVHTQFLEKEGGKSHSVRHNVATRLTWWESVTLVMPCVSQSDCYEV